MTHKTTHTYGAYSFVVVAQSSFTNRLARLCFWFRLQIISGVVQQCGDVVENVFQLVAQSVRKHHKTFQPMARHIIMAIIAHDRCSQGILKLSLYFRCGKFMEASGKNKRSYAYHIIDAPSGSAYFQYRSPTNAATIATADVAMSLRMSIPMTWKLYFLKYFLPNFSLIFLPKTMNLLHNFFSKE